MGERCLRGYTVIRFCSFVACAGLNVFLTAFISSLYFRFIANDRLSQAIPFPIISMLPGVCGALWSVFYFHEIEDRRSLRLLAIAVCITLAGSVCVGLSKDFWSRLQSSVLELTTYPDFFQILLALLLSAVFFINLLVICFHWAVFKQFKFWLSVGFNSLF